MVRLGRCFLPDQPLHVIQRGNNRDAVFFGEEDYARYRDWLAAAAADCGCRIHAYVLMTNHVRKNGVRVDFAGRSRHGVACGQRGEGRWCGSGAVSCRISRCM
jgi:hypothetical protein